MTTQGLLPQNTENLSPNNPGVERGWVGTDLKSTCHTYVITCTVTVIHMCVNMEMFTPHTTQECSDRSRRDQASLTPPHSPSQQCTQHMLSCTSTSSHQSRVVSE